MPAARERPHATTNPSDNPDKIKSSTGIKLVLFIAFLCYLAGGCGGSYFLHYYKGGYYHPGTTSTVTTILAISGPILQVLSSVLSSQARSAGLQRIATRAIKQYVSLAKLHRMDVATNGSFLDAIKGKEFWAVIYQLCLPLLAILTSAVWKKCLGTEMIQIPVDIVGLEASYIDPTNIDSGVRGTTWPAAVLYNTTAGMGSSFNLLQKSWTYAFANTSDETGTSSISYSMPSLPRLVAAGTSGYHDYASSSTPAIISRVQCSNDTYDLSTLQQSGGIQNDNNVILLGTLEDGTVVIQVSTSTDTLWSCTAHLVTTTEDVLFVSDGSGNWNISDANITASDSAMIFDISQARWNMLADIISDALGTTAGHSGWDWTTSTFASPGYTSMLAGTRLSFGVATLAYVTRPTTLSSDDAEGKASLRVERVVLYSNWALVTFVALLFSQGTVALLHILFFGGITIDFGILQIMEMQDSATRAGLSCVLRGNCSKRVSEVSTSFGDIAIRASEGHEPHLGFLRVDNGVAPTQSARRSEPEVTRWRSIDKNQIYH